MPLPTIELENESVKPPARAVKNIAKIILQIGEKRILLIRLEGETGAASIEVINFFSLSFGVSFELGSGNFWRCHLDSAGIVFIEYGTRIANSRAKRFVIERLYGIGKAL